MKGLRFFILLLLVHTLTVMGFGQARKYSYQHLTEADGLAQNFVYGLVQDARGFLWAGTGTGLSRYDGVQVKNFTARDGLSGDFVTAALRARSGNLIFGHNQGGITLFDGIRFDTLLRDTLGTRIVGIAEDVAENIWIATQSNGLIFLDRHRLASTEFILPPALENQIINVISVRGNILLVGCQEGLFLFAMKGKALTPIPFEGLPPYTEVTSVLPHKSDTTLSWIGTSFNGIYLFQHDPKQNKPLLQQQIITEEFSNDVILSMDQDQEGDLWLATRQNGVVYVNLGRNGKSVFKVKFFRKDSGYPMTAVNRVVVDRQGQVWAATMGDGLVKIYKEFFRYFSFGRDYGVEDVRAISETDSGYCVGTDKGLFIITFNTQSDEYLIQPLDILTNEPILSVYTDRNFNTWVGTENKGIFVYRHRNKTLKPIDFASGEEPVKARLFEEDKRGYLWISAVAQGLYVLDENRQLIKHLTTAERFIHNDIFALKADSKGNIWIGTYGAGLAMIDTKGELRLFSKTGILQSRDINDIAEDKTGAIWIATAGDGFFKYAANKFVQVGSHENLLTPYITGIQFDPQGRIWYSYRKGLGYYDLKSEKKRHFGVDDGLMPSEAYSSSIMVDSKLNKWFCNDYGVTLFENDTIRNHRRQLETYLTGIRIFFKEHPVHAKNTNPLEHSMVSKLPSVELSHEKNHITFDFAAIELNQPGKIYYRHLLQEYDSEWSPPATSNSITYTNLDPGRYVLKIQATDDPGSWVDPVMEYPFTITAPYWERTWFYLLQIVGVLMLFSITYFMGKKGVATKRSVLRIMLFCCFFITLEYVENFIDPLVSGFFGGAPLFRFLLNFILALLLLPVEFLITRRLMEEEKKSHPLSAEPSSSEPGPVEDVPVVIEDDQSAR